MTSRTRPPPSQHQQAHQAKLHLLRSLTTAFLPASPSSALFYAERLHALDPNSEQSAYLLASALQAQKEHLEAIWVLRQAVTFVPAAGEAGGNGRGDDPFGQAGGGGGATRRWASTSAGKLTRPALESSVRCARLYSDCCAAVGRAKEGREALARVLQPGVPLAPVEPATSPDLSFASDLLPPASFASSLDDPTALTLSLARLAYSSNDADRAIVSFRRVLSAVPTCWEAIETLCELGAAPDVDLLLPLPKRPAVTTAQQQQPIQQQQQHQQATKPLSNSNASSTGSNGAPSSPPPLGPSQTAAVNTAWAYQQQQQPQNGYQSSGGLFTPTDALPIGAKNGGGGGMLFGGGQNVAQNGQKGKGKEVIGLFGGPGMPVLPPGLRRTGSGRYVNGIVGGGPEMSMLGDLTGDESSFDTSFYPSAVQPLSFGSTAPSARNGISAPISTSLFTPPVPSALPTATAPGVKRTRAGNIAPASSAAAGGMAVEEDASSRPTGGRRPVRGVPEGKTRSASNGTSAAPGAPTRRSSRLSQNAVSSAMGPSRSQSSNGGGGGGRGTTVNGGGAARDKKRSKAGAGPSVLSDSTSTIGSDGRAVSPASSSPGPSSPGGAQAPAISSVLPPPPAAPPQPDAATLPARQEAEDYVLGLVRCFAKAEASLSRFDRKGVVDALGGLGSEQARTVRAVRLMGRASFEAGEYEKAEKAFQTARQLAPASLQSMDLLSTTLWHLRSPTALSYLAQDLHSLTSSSPSGTSSSSTQHPTPWIASGNVFSHLEDHSAALRCFKRAAQVDENCVYAYVLAGHECVMLEEWERALGFFREGVRRDKGGRGYGAWFGLGNVYLKTGKYTLAEYHFRRALEINPGNDTLICCVGTVLEKLERHQEALDVYERAVQLQPESALARFKRVRMVMTLRQYHLAESDLLALKHLAPSEPNVHYLLGRLYKQLGPSRRAEMLQAFARAQDLEPRMASVIREQIERATEEGGMDGMDVDDSSSAL